MDQIDAFVNRFAVWMDESGAIAEPDPDLIRELLECRAAVLGMSDPWAWPPKALWRTVAEVAPFSFPIDDETRAALIRTLPLLREFIVMEGAAESTAGLRKETTALLTMLEGGSGRLMASPPEWSLQRRTMRLWRDKSFQPPGDEADGSWSQRFAAMPWERRDELVGPLRRPPFELSRPLWGDVSVPRPKTVLPSVLAELARRAPLMTAVIEVAEYLADRPGVWSGTRLADDVVQQVLAATSLTDAGSVQEAWRLAVLAGLLWPTPLQTFRGEKLDLWADAGEVLQIWTDVAQQAASDLPDPLREQVFRRVLTSYFPGPSTEPETPAERVAVDRLRRLGVLDDTGLTALGLQGLVFRWARWEQLGEWLLTAGPWRPELSTADLHAWLRGMLFGLVVDEVGGRWVQDADPQVFAGQLVDAMLVIDDGAARAMAFLVLAQLGSSVTAVVDRLNGTVLHAYRSLWPSGDAVRTTSTAELELWVGDHREYYAVFGRTVERMRPGMQIDTSGYDFLGGDPARRPATNGPADMAELTALQESFFAARADFYEMFGSGQDVLLDQDGGTTEGGVRS
ncbi:hypothetical protein ACIA49_27300 [Kribbella sp. NPDC051587]|uniref:hypothetical protein n=1 Tax=Kribbella sp. NPDC051587 TaxID=3364119 RepID=UPI0037ACB784